MLESPVAVSSLIKCSEIKNNLAHCTAFQTPRPGLLRIIKVQDFKYRIQFFYDYESSNSDPIIEILVSILQL
jgi:hypothetical protein